MSSWNQPKETGDNESGVGSSDNGGSDNGASGGPFDESEPAEIEFADFGSSSVDHSAGDQDGTIRASQSILGSLVLN